jgi:hypothetical protein
MLRSEKTEKTETELRKPICRYKNQNTHIQSIANHIREYKFESKINYMKKGPIGPFFVIKI